ncbi:tyrosine-type recombinase/integrase, partial [Mycobacterium avium]|uniref:tyrosine-type recombinase/integrase n=1 Tax=Mycobacterium avium TaxID=1764 RepID=UPI00159306F1
VVAGSWAGEAARLDRDHVDLDAGVVRIANSKYDKSRQILLHHTTIAVLRDYSQLREHTAGTEGWSAFFVSASGRLVVNTIDYTFADLLGPAGIHTTTGQPHPRVGDLRHSFAVRTLLECYRGGADVQAQLPLLSTWMGHISPRRWASAADRGGGTPRIDGSSSSGAGGFLVVATWSNSLRPRAECELRRRRRVETVRLGWSHWAISRSGMVPPWPRGPRERPGE